VPVELHLLRLGRSRSMESGEQFIVVAEDMRAVEPCGRIGCVQAHTEGKLGHSIEEVLMYSLANQHDTW
jgi:hypothetical protein